MSDFTQAFQITFPHSDGTQVIEGFSVALGLCSVENILITFPPGCAGNVGIQMQAGGSPAFPNQDGQYLIFDDYTYVQSVSNQITTGQWNVQGYNTDYDDHTVQVVFECNYLAYSPGIPSAAPLSL